MCALCACARDVYDVELLLHLSFQNAINISAICFSIEIETKLLPAIPNWIFKVYTQNN